ncbi:MAG TPA: Tar ligand binding domain-containing protein, partial [Quisquiliibacterium sp.]|nr:Tar ligand binding domain-containing protein [Quisquiliibacterium sp.]
MMNTLKVSTRLALLIGLLSFLLLAVGTLGLFGIARSNDALQSVYADRTVPAGQIGEIRALMLRNRLALSQALLTPTPEVISSRLAEIDRQVARIDTLWAA